jgi:uncharacterized membrane protein
VTGTRSAGGERPATSVELRIARTLLVGAVVGITLITVGVVLMAVNGIDPLQETFPAFEVARVIPDMLALRPEGFLWAGIAIIIATPIARVVGELVTFAIHRDAIMAVVAVLVLAVVALSVVAALALEG